MKLYVTPRSPYARLAQVVVIEKGLEDRVEVLVAKTRTADSPYYAVAPSGRVPFLVRDDGVSLEDSRLICEYLDALVGPRRFGASSDGGWEHGRLEALVRSFLDGLAVLGREQRRPESERSAEIVAHESARAERLADALEREIEHPLLGAQPPSLVALLAIITIEYGRKYLAWDATHERPRLAAFAEAMSRHPSIARTRVD